MVSGRGPQSQDTESVAHTAAADAGLFHDGTLQPREDAASSALGPACRQEGEPHHWDGGYYPRPQPRGRAHHAALSQIPFSTWLHVASPYQECWDTTKGLIFSVNETVWTLRICSTRWVGRIQKSTTCLERSLPHFCCATPSRDFSLTFTCSGNGIHTAQLLQGHSNQVVDPYSTHHPLTYDEAMCLGWIFHVTDSANVPSIRRSGLMTDAKGSGRGGRDALHFMYHNDNGQGYIRMAEGTTPPRQYRQPAYFVLDPKFIESQQLFLTKTGVVLFFGDIPQLSFCAFKISYQQWHATFWDQDEVTCSHLRWQEAHGQLMLAMDMFDMKKVLALHLEVLFLKRSEQQHGSSWAKRSLRTMGSLSLVFLWHQRLILIQHSS